MLLSPTWSDVARLISLRWKRKLGSHLAPGNKKRNRSLKN